MSDAETRAANQAWGAALAWALSDAGVRRVCVSPGSRSTPLVLALASRPELHCVVCLDERSAAFFALGIGRVARVPAAVVTTSGTAVANLFPAVVEAAQSEVPLLLLTADRPPEVGGSDANQTIDQRGIFGGYVREAMDAGAPSADPEALRILAARTARAVARTRARPAGPVHLNLPFAKPLEPETWPSETEAWPSPLAPAVGAGPDRDLPRRPGTIGVLAGASHPSPDDVREVAEALRSAVRPLLVCGGVPDPEGVGPSALALAEAAAIPVLADPLSGARFGAGAVGAVAGASDRFLTDRSIREALLPDFVLRVGATPTSASAQSLLAEAADVPQVVIDGGGLWKDPRGLASGYLRADERRSLEALREEVGRRSDAGTWTQAWSTAERAAQAVLTDATEAVAEEPGEGFEGAIARAVTEALPSGGLLFASSSMPVRDVDAFAAPRDAPLTVLGNRGASGIDGIVSSVLGVGVGAAAHRRPVGVGGAAHRPPPTAASPADNSPPVTGLIGDLALLHDANGLALAEAAPEAVLVVVNNDGGGIFDLLPIHRYEPAFTRFFATPHGRDLSVLAAFHGVAHDRVDTLAELVARLREGRGGLVEVRTRRDTNRRMRAEVTDRVVGAAMGVLGSL